MILLVYVGRNRLCIAYVTALLIALVLTETSETVDSLHDGWMVVIGALNENVESPDAASEAIELKVCDFEGAGLLSASV